MEQCMVKPQDKKRTNPPKPPPKPAPEINGNNPPERRDKATPVLPPRPTNSELSNTQYHIRRAAFEQNEVNGNLTRAEPNMKPAGTPVVPPRSTEKRMRAQAEHMQVSTEDRESGDTEEKEKGSFFSGLLKKSHKPKDETGEQEETRSVHSELSASNDSLSETKEKGGFFSGILKKSHKPKDEAGEQEETRSVHSELSGSKDSLSETKEKGSKFSGMFKKSPKTSEAAPTEEDQRSLHSDQSTSSDNLSENSKEKGGFFSGLKRKSPKLPAEETPIEDQRSAQSDLSASNDSLSEKHHNTKEKGGVFAGMFRRSPKPSDDPLPDEEDLSASSSELSASSDNLSENNNTKEKGGMFGGMFRKPKAMGDKTKSQEDLSANSQLSVSSDSLSEKTSKGGMMGKILRNPFQSSSQDKERAESSTAENSNANQTAMSGMSNSTFYADEKEKSPDSDGELLDNEQSSHKQNRFVGAMNKLNPFHTANKYEKAAEEDDEPSVHKQNTVAEAISKLNPFRSAHKKDSEGTEALKENQIKDEEKPKPVKGNMIQQERKERGESPRIPTRPSEEELKGTGTYENLKGTKATDHQENRNMIPRERRGRGAGAPKPTVESQSGDEGLREDEEGCTTESKTAKVKKRHNPFMPRAGAKAQSDDEGLKEDETENKEENQDKQEETKVRKAQKPNPFVPRANKQAQSDDEGLEEESSFVEDSQVKAEAKTEETKVKKPKKHNPFMPRVKAKAGQKKEAVTANETAENENASRPLFDRLEELRIDRTDPEEDMQQDFAGLMEWWRTVEQWEDVTEDEDMTEKEEAKAFAVMADKVQKGIRVFNKLFSERAETLWQHVIDLNTIADSLDKFNKNTKIAQITGGSTSAIGGVATIVGLALAPVTMGTSLIITAVGLGVATSGGLTSAGGGISNQVNNSMNRKKVEKIVEDYQEKMTDLNKCMLFIKQGIEHLRKFDLLKMKKHAYNRDFPALNSNFYKDGAMAGKAILINANEIMRVVQIANVAGSTAARAVQIASMATGVLTGLFVGMDIYFVAKDSKELKKGAKSEFAAKIREVAQQLHDGLVELNSIREELHSTETPAKTSDDAAASDKAKKETGDEKPDSSEEEDEIDRIKKAIKKDYENREYV